MRSPRKARPSPIETIPAPSGSTGSISPDDSATSPSWVLSPGLGGSSPSGRPSNRWASAVRPEGSAVGWPLAPGAAGSRPCPCGCAPGAVERSPSAVSPGADPVRRSDASGFGSFGVGRCPCGWDGGLAGCPPNRLPGALSRVSCPSVSRVGPSVPRSVAVAVVPATPPGSPPVRPSDGDVFRPPPWPSGAVWCPWGPPLFDGVGVLGSGGELPGGLLSPGSPPPPCSPVSPGSPWSDPSGSGGEKGAGRCPCSGAVPDRCSGRVVSAPGARGGA